MRHFDPLGRFGLVRHNREEGMNFLKSRKGVALLAMLVVAAVAAVGAYAYFTSTGNGSGTGSTGSASTWTVTTDAHTGGPLFPGNGSESIAYHVANPGSGNQELNSVVIKVANANGSAWNNLTCTAADFSVDGQAGGASATDTYGGPTNDVAPADSRSGSITLTMLDTGVAQDDCQGLTNVPLYISAS
jgi:archaellin